MDIFRFFSNVMYSNVPFLYPFWFVFFSWLIWFILKRRNLPRPNLSLMLIFSAAVGITYIKAWQRLRTCLNNPSCDPDPSLPFILIFLLGEISFWLIVLYVPIALVIKPVKLLEHKRNRWIALFAIVLAVWNILVAHPFDILRNLTYTNLITIDFYFFPVMALLFPWFIWMLLEIIQRPRPALPTMLIFSISIANASTRLWVQEYVCNFGMSRRCEVYFSFPLFLVEIALWFIPLYALLKLIVRQEVALS